MSIASIKNEEDRRLLYIAATRALHELEIYTYSKGMLYNFY